MLPKVIGQKRSLAPSLAVVSRGGSLQYGPVNVENIYASLKWFDLSFEQDMNQISLGDCYEKLRAGCGDHTGWDPSMAPWAAVGRRGDRHQYCLEWPIFLYKEDVGCVFSVWEPR